VADLVVRAPLANRDALAELDGYLPQERRAVRDALLVDGLTALRRRLYRESLTGAVACARAFEVQS
jgi:hypothetical protein